MSRSSEAEEKYKIN